MLFHIIKAIPPDLYLVIFLLLFVNTVKPFICTQSTLSSLLSCTQIMSCVSISDINSGHNNLDFRQETFIETIFKFFMLFV